MTTDKKKMWNSLAKIFIYDVFEIDGKIDYLPVAMFSSPSEKWKATEFLYAHPRSKHLMMIDLRRLVFTKLYDAFMIKENMLASSEARNDL
jgi:hypothetical protein